jgi:hypothetical protein
MQAWRSQKAPPRVMRLPRFRRMARLDNCGLAGSDQKPLPNLAAVTCRADHRIAGFAIERLGKRRSSSKKQGYQDVVELLLSNRAKVDGEDEYSHTPLHWVAIKGHSDMAGLLLANNAGVNAIAKDGETPLHEAATAGNKDVAELLLAHAVKHVKKRDERREMIDKDLRLED